jgi:hypothetical protein
LPIDLFGIWENQAMGKTSAGGVSLVCAVLALSQRLGNYENRPLAIILAVGASFSLLWFASQLMRDSVAKIKDSKSRW